MTVLFLHGLAGSRATYDWLPASLDGHDVVRPDFRGHGTAPRTRGAYLIADYAADAVAALRETGPAFVVGHSLGGVAAWWAAQLVPELVLGAVLEDPPLFLGSLDGPAGNGSIPQFRYLRAVASDWQAEGVTAVEAVRRVAARPYGTAPSPTLGEVLTAEALEARAYALLHADPAVLDTVIDGTLLAATDVVAPITVPMAILAADEALGSAFTTAHEAQLAVTHPAITVTRLAGAGHSIHDERAHRDAYLEHVTAFVSRSVEAARS